MVKLCFRQKAFIIIAFILAVLFLLLIIDFSTGVKRIETI